jgi:hypothetical protein
MEGMMSPQIYEEFAFYLDAVQRCRQLKLPLTCIYRESWAVWSINSYSATPERRQR